MNGDDFGQVPDNALGEEESQGQLFFQAREAHEHLEGLTPQPDFQGLLHHHPVRGLLNMPLPVTPDGEFAKGFSHSQLIRVHFIFRLRSVRAAA